MDRIFELKGVYFEWDEDKNASNQRKHGVTFEEGAEVFFDPEQQFGDASIEHESRAYVIGYSVSSRVLLVVFVERGVRTRIITARRATRSERKEYEE